MAQTILLTLSFLLAAAFILAPTSTEAACNECTAHGIACVNETSFNVCHDNKPDTNNVFTCPSGKVCSVTGLKCVDPTMGGKPACEPLKGCGVCDGVKMFTCTSRTTFAQCDGEKMSEVNIKCPEGLTCNSAGKEICMNACTITHECDRETPL